MNLVIVEPVERLGEHAPRVTGDLFDQNRCRTTRWSVVLAAAAGDEAARSAMAKLYRAYWQPVFSTIAKRRGAAAARELTQAFFVNRLVEGGDLRRVRRLPGQRFRGWLFAAVHSFLKSQWTFERRQRRDVRRTVALCSDDAVGAPAAYLAIARPDPEQQLQRARVLKLLSEVLGRLRREYCKSAGAAGVDAERRFDAVKVFLPGPDSELADYRECAAALGSNPDAVKQLVRRLRGRFGQLLHDVIRQSVESEADVQVAKRLLCHALDSSESARGDS